LGSPLLAASGLPRQMGAASFLCEFGRLPRAGTIPVDMSKSLWMAISLAEYVDLEGLGEPFASERYGSEAWALGLRACRVRSTTPGGTGFECKKS